MSTLVSCQFSTNKATFYWTKVIAVQVKRSLEKELQMLTSPVTHVDALVVGPSRVLSDIDCGIDNKKTHISWGMMFIERIVIYLHLLKGSKELPRGWDSRRLCKLAHRGWRVLVQNKVPYELKGWFIIAGLHYTIWGLYFQLCNQIALKYFYTSYNSIHCVFAHAMDEFTSTPRTSSPPKRAIHIHFQYSKPIQSYFWSISQLNF